MLFLIQNPKDRSELKNQRLSTLIHSCQFKNWQPALAQYWIGRVAQYSIGADTPYVVPLVSELVVLLEQRKAVHDEFLQQNPPKTKHDKLCANFVFPSAKSKTGHIVNMNRIWADLKKKANIIDLRLHDLRRTMGSWQAKTGASLVVIGKSLNHKDPTATAIYARLDMDPVRDSMTTAASAMFEAAGLKPKAEVIDFPAKTARTQAG